MASVITEDLLGRRVKQARESAELTQAELARRIGIDQPGVSRIEKGSNISTLLLAKIAEATDKSLDYFVRPEPVEATAALLKLGSAKPPAVRRAIQDLVELIEDYEFLKSVTS